MHTEQILAVLPERLLPWYDDHRRCLPWREDREPYHIWVSEIMLQQTRVEAVKGYYARFLSVLPTVQALADCDDDLLHKLWEGLGYYSRVRNMKKAAQIIMTQYDGRFPQDYRQVLSLPGIGEYTAGAICSIAYNAPTPAVDGNVLRLVSRLTDDSTPIDLPAVKVSVQARLAAVYPARAGDFTKALMELGATVCGPNRAPDCESCPCRDICLGHARGSAEKLPVKSPRREKRREEKTVFILRWEGRYALQRRPEDGLLAGLWQFPNISGFAEPSEALEQARRWGLHPRELCRQVRRKHIFTHIIWDMWGYYLDVKEPGGDFVWLTGAEIDAQAALPTAFRLFWEETDHV